jgi:CubicO group peptidase (beta-lactamase class C family)
LPDEPLSPATSFASERRPPTATDDARPAFAASLALDAIDASPWLDALLTRAIVDAAVAPSASIAVLRRPRSGGPFVGAVGASGSSIGTAAIFDLASITKTLTAIGALDAIARGALSLDATVGEVLPALAALPAASATTEALLCHRAGLPDWGALYAPAPFEHSAGQLVALPSAGENESALPSLAAMLAAAASRRAHGQAAHRYSDLGYVLLAAMLAERHPTSLGWMRPPRREVDPAAHAAFLARVQPTEIVPFRGGAVRGVVHDENAWALSRRGFIAGHAGAFGTALEVAAIGAAMLDGLVGHGPLARIDRRLLRRAVTPASGDGTHGLGFDTVATVGSSAGARFSRASFGHLGFTGGSLWCDPDGEIVVALLTNRTFPSRQNVRIRAARPAIHDEVRRAIDEGAL